MTRPAISEFEAWVTSKRKEVENVFTEDQVAEWVSVRLHKDHFERIIRAILEL